MAQAKMGDQVRIHFTGRMEDGTVFDTTYEDECDTDKCGDDDCNDDDCCSDAGPMDLTLGEEDFFVTVENAIIGMAPGEKKTVVVTPEDGFGEYEEDNVLTIGRDQFPDDLVPAVDMDLELNDEEGGSFVATVIDVDEENVSLDANHPLAGETLTVEIELLEILKTIH